MFPCKPLPKHFKRRPCQPTALVAKRGMQRAELLEEHYAPHPVAGLGQGPGRRQLKVRCNTALASRHDVRADDACGGCAWPTRC
jgi:hypothetical protein